MSLDDVFGSSGDLTAAQMSARAFVMFFVMLGLTRLAGMRAFSRKSAFDVIVVITLGAVISRVIVGASPAIPAIAAAMVLAAVHRAIASATATSPRFERLIKGRSHAVYRDGAFDDRRMHRAGISRADIEQAVRKHSQGRLEDVREVRLEHTGELSVIERDGVERDRNVARA